MGFTVASKPNHSGILGPPVLTGVNKHFPGQCTGGLNASRMAPHFSFSICIKSSLHPWFQADLMSLSSSSSNALLSAPSCRLPPRRCSTVRSQGWLLSASSASQRLLYLFLKAFSLSVAQQLLTHPGSCEQLLLLSIPWQFFSCFRAQGDGD